MTVSQKESDERGGSLLDLSRLTNASMTRRNVLRGGMVGAAALGLGGLLSACGSAGSNGNRATITHWDWFVSQEPWVTNEIELFQKANPSLGIERTLNQFDQYANVISLAQRSKSLPDVYMLPFQPSLAEQVSNGWLTPLNDYVDDSWIRSYPKYSFIEGSNVFDGKVYSAPVTGTGPLYQLYINNQVFADAGLVDSDGKALIPKTWDDVARYASTINKKSNGSVYGLGMGTNGGGILNAWVNTFVLAAGSPGGFNTVDYRIGRYTFGTDRNYADVLELFKDWHALGYFHPDSLSATDEIARVSFATGKFGMTVAGSYAISPWITNNDFDDFSITTLIGPEEDRRGYFSSVPGGSMLGVSADSTQPEQAFQWLSWWGGKEAGARFTQTYNIDLSIHPEDNAPSKIESPRFAEYAALESLVRLGPSPKIVNPEVAKVKVAAVTPGLADIAVGILTGQVSDIGKALTALGDDSNAALDTGIADAVSTGARVSRDDYVFEDWDITRDYEYTIPEYPEL